MTEQHESPPSNRCDSCTGSGVREQSYYTGSDNWGRIEYEMVDCETCAGTGVISGVQVIMRTFERPVLLARAVASVVQQTFSDWSLVIVNNGGDPRTVESVVAAAGGSLDSGKIEVRHLDARVGMEAASN